MHPRLLVIAVFVIAIPLSMYWKAEPSNADSGRLPVSARSQVEFIGEPGYRSPFQFVGAGSCSAAACHNGTAPGGRIAQPPGTGGEYTTWVAQDRHARAYDVLFDDRSVRMQTLLHAAAPAHEDQRCLSCHVAPSLPATPPKNAPYFRNDGVSCESCHGPAEKWLAVHYQDSWKGKTAADKQRLGMNDTHSLLGRARVCVSCHVGGPGHDVDHDLIAAGHPRLNFEFTSFHAHMPHHWSDVRDRAGRADFEAQGWILGQLVSTHAALELLADRAHDRKKPWPEFAEHDCYACHHDLQAPSWRQKHPPEVARGGKLGSVPWNPWYPAMTHQALRAVHVKDDPLAELLKAMQGGWSKRTEIAGKARQSAHQLQQILATVEQKLKESPAPAALFRQILTEESRKMGQSWDEANQTYLALAALHQAQVEMKEPIAVDVRPALRELMLSLEFPKGFDSRGGFDPEAVRKRLAVILK